MNAVTDDLDNGPEPSRRAFLKSGAAAALVIGISVGEGIGRVLAAPAAAPFAPNAFLRITADGRVTVICPSVEMGQGVLTSIPMLVAEELDADWTTVRVEQAPTDPVYNNPAFGMQGTGGSTTVRAWWEPMRKAGATARSMLVGAAAQQWKVDPATLKTASGHVIASDGRKLAYGDLVAAAATQPVPASPRLKDPSEFRILGQPLHRLDTAGKIDGSARFGLDADVPGLKVAVMARAPLPGAKVASLDAAKARAVKGVIDVLTIPSGVAVIADGFWAAKRGRDLLAVTWDLGEHARLDSAAITTMLTGAADKASAVALEKGTPQAAVSGARAAVDALYEAPYLAHACMEPMNCTAWVRGDEVEVWAGTQSQGPQAGILSQVAQVAPGKVKVNALLLGGGFGRRFAPDVVIDATLLSKLSGHPVKLVYTREDDMAAGFYRPASVARFSATLDAANRPAVLKVGVGSPSVMAASGFMKLPESGVDAMAMEGVADHPYDIEHQRLAYGRAEPGPQVWFWRSVGHSQNIFFMEGFIDELAVAAGKDPFEFRRALLGKQPRYRAVLEAAAEKAGWGKPLPAGVHRGIAVAQSFGSYVAEVAEVSVGKDGTPKVHRVVAAVDCGRTVNPEIIRRQIEGAIVFGLSAALYGRISYKDGHVEQGNFNDYPVLRMSETPRVEVHILPSTEAPGGIGEPGTPPIAPAVVNAIYAATGKRLRRLPIDTAALKRV
jgi:isoquinoline 1-oxidoreductase subunit beta